MLYHNKSVFLCRLFVLVLGVFCLHVQSGSAATITVNNPGDAGTDCTFREAIETINNGHDLANGCVPVGTLGTEDKVIFSVDSVNLSSPEVDITRQVIVEGGVSGVTVTGDGTAGLLTLREIGITINNLTLTGGIANLNTDYSGGAIYARGSIFTLNNCIITGNTANKFGGGVFIGYHSRATINDAVVELNTGIKGGGLYVNNSTLTLNSSTVRKNRAVILPGVLSTRGGGLFVEVSTATINDSSISENHSEHIAGGIEALHVSVLNINDSTINRNTAAYIGGIELFGGVDLIMKSSTISGNKSQRPPGSSSGGAGGMGLWGQMGTPSLEVHATLINSTISGNIGDYNAGGIYVYHAYLTLINCTIADNTIPNSNNQGLVVRWNDSGSVVLKNTIIANYPSDRWKHDCYAPAGSVVADSHNIIQDGSCNTQALAAPVRLAPLADNGGPTKTHALRYGSPAIGLGDSAVCAAPDTVNNLDQRGVVRPLPEGSVCDIGAYEYFKETKFYVIPAKNGRQTIINL